MMVCSVEVYKTEPAALCRKTSDQWLLLNDRIPIAGTKACSHHGFQLERRRDTDAVQT
jgi:hypothetical protein